MKKTADKVEVDGIEVVVDLSMGSDYELAEAVAVVNDPSSSPAEALRARVRMYKIVLGGSYERVKSELRERGGGKVTNEAMDGFVGEVMSKVSTLKNS